MLLLLDHCKGQTKDLKSHVLSVVRGQATVITTTIIHTIQVHVEEKKQLQNKYRKQSNRRSIIIYTIFELVCNSQSSKAFEFADQVPARFLLNLLYLSG